MRECLSCKEKYPEVARKCPACGSNQWILLPGSSIETPPSGVRRPEGVRWVGAFLCLLGLVVTMVGLDDGGSQLQPRQLSLVVVVLALAGTLFVLGIGLLRLSAWGYWSTLVLLAMDIVLSIVRRFPGGEAERVRFGIDMVLLAYLAPWVFTFASPRDEAQRPEPSRLASLVGLGKTTAVDWARLGVFASAWLVRTSAVVLVPHLFHGAFPEMNRLSAIALDAVFLAATLALMLRWLGGEILATVLTTVVATIVHLLTLWLVVYKDSFTYPVLIQLAGEYAIVVSLHVGVLAMMLHALKCEWVGVLAGSLGGGAAALIGVIVWRAFSSHHLPDLHVWANIAAFWPSNVASVLSFATVLTAGTLLLRQEHQRGKAAGSSNCVE